MSPGSHSLPSWWWSHPPLQNLRGTPDTCPKIHSFNQRCPTQSRFQSILGVLSFYVERKTFSNWPVACAFQVILIFNDERNSSVIRWTDPSISVDGQYNASFHLCDNKFHKVVMRRNLSDVEFQVDDHSAVRGTVPSSFSLQHGTFHIGGVPGKKRKKEHVL